MSNWQQKQVGGALLIDHSGGRFVDRGGLKGLHCPEPTATWKPVPHSELVESLLDGLKEHDIEIKAEQYCIAGRNDARLFGVFDLAIPHLTTPDYGMAMGFRGSNDQSLAIQATAGAKVTCCSNMLFAGDTGTIVLKRKHTSGLDLSQVVPPAIDAYLEKAGQFVLDITKMKELEMTDAMAKECIYDAFIGGRKVLPVNMLRVIHDFYFTSDEQRAMFPDRTMWSLSNAFTEAVKTLKPTAGQNASLKIGSYFARALHKLVRPVQLALPMVIDVTPDDEIVNN